MGSTDQLPRLIACMEADEAADCLVSWPPNAGTVKSSDPRQVYDVIDKIGDGGFEGITVHRARRKRGHNQKIVAIKIFALKALHADDIRMLTKEAEKEINTLQRCKVPGVISYYESFHHKKEFWIVMELCEGGSLRQVMNKVMTLRGKPMDKRLKVGDKPPFQEIQIAFIMKQSLDALCELHRSKLIHRDIKAANVLLSKTAK